MNDHKSSIIFDLDGTKPQFSMPHGNRTVINADNFPVLKGMGAVLLRMEKGGVREPHWHPNAGELNYVIEGKVRFTVYGSNKEIETSEIGKGQVFFVPAGYFHYLEKSDDVNNGTVASFLGNENPEFIGLVGGLSSYSDEVLEAVFNTDQKFFSNLPRLVKNVLIAPGLD
ncbi:cupin domain-containing protein [Candidatus Nitrosocosmicus sp. R]